MSAPDSKANAAYIATLRNGEPALFAAARQIAAKDAEIALLREALATIAGPPNVTRTYRRSMSRDGAKNSVATLPAPPSPKETTVQGEYRARIWQDGKMVAQVFGTDLNATTAEGQHYLAVYSRDGSTTMSFDEKRGRRWCIAASGAKENG